ncbi:Asp23/Gls24 family envelope stress response protein [Brochothrix thermosphacta]|uniref:Asp23/Gls24 family envelope stress response protein n=1 Tax=Brochothrix thermosphacta TaxID=2756 RepID=UPI00083FB41E|nr:Asp23/Gls24 family envelope stress response protein [Brochothrix thermosphacta]SLM94056.1 Putative alkaline-shock protein [Brachybacterium faecium]ANZ94158.1 hypothetical protein BFC19_01275 [Brochothrix thermosphacta]ANZ97546.1 hypothetical protein BFC20_07505 [Brochothrix thermosphacta]MDO7862916.1 Asp23/Gls24 family envelope stress response protein [Brochothrix thermosphacta]ODJ57066.1 hypothetical protein BFR41_00560 [Brochothrix thermosphacta]
MSIEIETKLGQIDIADEVIATIAGDVASSQVGVVGMTSKKYIRDSFTDLLKKENNSKGVVVSRNDKGYVVDVYVVVTYGVKISEVARNIQENIKYNLAKQLNIQAEEINVYIQDVRLMID